MHVYFLHVGKQRFSEPRLSDLVGGRDRTLQVADRTLLGCVCELAQEIALHAAPMAYLELVDYVPPRRQRRTAAAARQEAPERQAAAT